MGQKVHCKEINNFLPKLKGESVPTDFAIMTKSVEKKRLFLWYHFATYKLLRNYEKRNN